MKEESKKPDLKLSIKKTKIMTSDPITQGMIEEEKVEAVTDFIFLGFKITVDDDWSHEIKRHLLLYRQCVKMWQCIKKQRPHFANKGLYSQNYGFSTSHVRVWELNHKEVWEPQNWCFQIAVLREDSWESLGLQVDQTNQS